MEDKRSIAAKAKTLCLPISELMRRAVFAHDAASFDGELEALADKASLSAERAGTAIDDPAGNTTRGVDAGGVGKEIK